MKIRRIETLENWAVLAESLRSGGWTRWQLQYNWDMPEGLHVWFMKPDHEDVEIVTHNEQVAEEIVDYKL